MGFSVGDRIEARWNYGLQFYPGHIADNNVDGTYNINYDDGASEENVDPDLIRFASTMMMPR